MRRRFSGMLLGLAILPPLPVAGDLVEVLVQQPGQVVSGVVAERAGGMMFGLSACRLGEPEPGSPFAPGALLSFRLPFDDAVTAELRAGGCGEATGIALELPLPVLGALTAATCRHAGKVPRRRTLRRARRATLCEMNRARAAAGVAPLARSGALARAARAHNGDMVQRRFFAHEGPSGPALQARLDRAGWSGGLAGENLGLGGLKLATPREMVRAWTGSPPHRANLLEPRFRVAGVAISPRNPLGAGRRSAVYTVDFGSRR